MSNKKPEIEIKGKIQDMNKQVKNIKPKQSNFLLTININQQYKDNDEHLENDIEAFNCLALIYESGICIDVLTPSKIEPL